MLQRGGKSIKVVWLVMAMITSVLLALPVSASGASGDHIRGVVSPRNQAAKLAGAGGNLAYHNGPVMHTNTVYAIYWIPSGYSVSANYQSVINGFFQNVAADSGKTSNVYYSDTQYTDKTTGNILYSSTLAGSVVDTNPFPANGCSDSYTTVCLSDAQLQTELQKVMSANGWTGGSTKLYFIFTPENVGSCAGSSCAFSQFCAYHSWIGSGSSATMYANQPYASFVPAACDSGQHPNGDDADATINVVSHEHNEAVTDPQGSAWYDRRGYENGDKCAWNFGTATGSTSFGQYNQSIGTGKYYLQQEWSNATSKCVLTNK
jgi:hypothetical protein